MRVGQRYWVILCVAVVALVVYAALPKHSASPAQLSESRMHGMETSALHRLRLPQGFTHISKRCSIGRCYVTNAPGADVEAMMPTLLRSAGFQPPGRLLAAEPIAQLKKDHWSMGSSDPLVIACKRIAASPLETCQDAARIGPTLVNVLVRPAAFCRKGACVDLRKTEVITWAAALPGAA